MQVLITSVGGVEAKISMSPKWTFYDFFGILGHASLIQSHYMLVTPCNPPKNTISINIIGYWVTESAEKLKTQYNQLHPNKSPQIEKKEIATTRISRDGPMKT